MVDPSTSQAGKLTPETRRLVYRRHYQGAMVRTSASLLMWTFAWLAFANDHIKANHFWGITFSVAYIILINPPTLIAFKYLNNRSVIRYFSLFINFLEIIGYTSIIYFLGGFEAAYLIPIYAAIIVYVGILSPKHFPFIVAALSSITFAAMVALETSGIIPHQNIQPTFHMDLENLVINTLVVTGLLFVVAYISSYNAGLLKRNRDRLRDQNVALKEQTETIARAEQKLREAHDELEKRVEERTKDLVIANRKLTQEIKTREAAQLSLQASEARYRDLFNNVRDYLYQHDLEGNFTEYNRVFKDKFPIPEGAASNLNVKDIMPDGLHPQFEDYMARLLEHGTDEGHFRALGADGKEIIVEYKNSLVHDYEGAVIGVRGSGRDVTDKILIRREKKNLEAQLARAQRMEAIGTLAGGIAHNFNNLLMGIQGNASLAGLRLDGEHPVREYLSKIEALIKSGSKLTRELLGYAREGRYEVQSVDLNTLIRQSARTFGETRKEITIHLNLAEDQLGIKGDISQMEQVLYNLYINAADAMPEGGSLHLKTRRITHRELKAGAHDPKPGSYVHLEVRDTGSGMDEDTLNHLFEPFFTTKGLGKGTGLGLASVYGIVKGHHGYIEVDSETGAGTSFHVYLPVSRQERTVEGKTPSPKSAGGRETILLVDDEAIVLDVWTQILEQLGYHTIKADNGEEALEIYENNLERIDLVILDMVMPEMGGGETYDRLKIANPGVKVLLSSGYSLDGQAREIMNRGCDGFVQKPFKPEHLSRKIREILDSKKDGKDPSN